jgi:hypothetical protein
MIIFTNRRIIGEWYLFRFADVLFNNGQIKYFTIKVLNEKINAIKILNKLEPGEILPHFSLQYIEKKNTLIQNQIFGILNFESINDAVNISNQHKQGEILNGYHRHYVYEFNKFKVDVIPMNNTTECHDESVFSFRVYKDTIGRKTEEYKICFSHRIENKIYVTDSNVWRGSSYKCFQTDIKVDHVFYDLGKKEYLYKNFELAVYYFDATIWFFKESKHKSHLIGNALRHKAKSLLSLRKHQEANECYLNPKCLVKNSWDYFYRSEIYNSSNDLMSHSLEYLVDRKNDLTKFRELIIAELKENKSTCFIEKVLSQEKDYFDAFNAYYKSFIYESIYSYIIFYNHNKAQKIVSQKADYLNAKEASDIFSKFWDELLDSIDIYDSTSIEEHLWCLSLSINEFNTNKYIEETPKKILGRRLDNLKLKCQPHFSYLYYWESKIRWSLYSTNKVRYFNSMENINANKFKSLDHITMKFKDSANIFDYIWHDPHTCPFEFLENANEERGFFNPMNRVNDYIYFEICDIFYQKGKINYFSKKYATCIEDMNKQLKLFVKYYGNNDLDAFDRFYCSKSASFFGSEILFEIYYIKSCCEIKLKNYRKAYYDLFRAFEYYDKYPIETDLLQKAKRKQKSLANKMVSIPTNAEIAEHYYKKAIDLYKLLLEKLASLLNIKNPKGLLCLINESFSYIFYKYDYDYKYEILGDLRAIIYNLEKHKELKGKKHPRKVHSECYLFLHWLDEQWDRRVEMEEQEREFPNNWKDILGGDEAGCAYWNLD